MNTLKKHCDGFMGKFTGLFSSFLEIINVIDV